MKLLYDHTIFQQRYGGISRVFFEIISRVVLKKDVDVDLFMGVFVNEYGLEKFRGAFNRFWGYKVPVIPKTGFLRRFINKVLWNKFQSKLSNNKSIYHPTYYNFYENNASKKVFTVHDFTHERYQNLFKGDSTIDLKKKAFAVANGLICISESTKKDLMDLYDIDPSCKIAVIYNGYNELQDKSVDVNLPDAPYILFVGPRYHYKNFVCLIEAYAADSTLKKDFVLVCLGEAFSANEKELFRKYGILDRVLRFEGGDDVLGTLYKKAHIFVYPSLYEGFGLSPLEAMSCNCPVVASNSSSIPEVVGEAAVMFDPSSSESLRDSLCRVAYDGQLRASMVLSGKDRCKLFSWDRCAVETYDFYKKLLEE